ncbi:hypothetical protein GF343_04985 [Candidatus Woesearchaeota archaeon]|nr:hypothetical protein [Candidatus Woesearchaeota archaeon]
MYPRQERIKGYRKLLNLPEHILPVAFVPIGYPAEKKSKENRYKQERVHKEKWENYQ